MTLYRVMYGAYVRAYAGHGFEAGSDEAALAKAVAEFKANGPDLDWTDEDYGNLALPSIVDISPDGGAEIATGVDFAANADDARDMAAPAMLDALRQWRSWLAAGSGPEKDALLAEATRLTGEALAAAEAEEGGAA